MTEPAIGELREKIGFYIQVEEDDGYGNTTSGWKATPEFIVSAAVVPKLGGETVMAGRLQGHNLVNVHIRSSEQTREIGTDWKAKNERSGVEYNIRSVINPDKRDRFLELLCESGVAI